MIQSIRILFVLYCILTYFLFSGILYITTPLLLFWSDYIVALDHPFVYSLILTIHFLFLQPISRDYSRFWFDYIISSVNNTGKRCVLMIYRHKGKCNSLIFILLLFLLHQKYIQDKTRWLFIIVLQFVKSFVWC